MAGPVVVANFIKIHLIRSRPRRVVQSYLLVRKVIKVGFGQAAVERLGVKSRLPCLAKLGISVRVATANTALLVDNPL